MEIFKLPIQYIPHKSVNAHIVKDLELVQTEDGEIPVYEKIFKPSTPESKHITKQWANYYTTDTTFLTESNGLFRQAKSPESIESFVQHWKSIQENKEFKISYQYIESNRLNWLNKSASFLTFISVYFITSPILFILTPLIMLIIPFAMIRINNTELTWKTIWSF